MGGDRWLRVVHHCFISVIVIAAMAALMAQSVVDPRYVEFNPSPDHNSTSNGTPIVQSYSLQIFTIGSSTPVDTMDLGKPAPVAGIIRVDFLPLLHVTLTPNVVYEARVNAVGPGGIAPSTVSNSFAFSPTCTPAISPTSQSVGAGGGTGSVAVSLATGCAWSATSNVTWITLTGATSGNGNGSVPYSVVANPSSLSRTGTLTIAGQTFTVTQAGVACGYTISPTSNPSVPSGGGTGSVSVASPTGCSWSSTSNAAWITFSGATTGSGNGSVNYSVAANSSTSSRTGTLTIAGQTFTVTQAGVPCSYSISPTSNPSVVAGGGTGTVNVTAQTGCTWSSTSNAAWITFSGATTGSGNGAVNYSVAANSSSSSRTGTLTIAGQTFTVTQAGVPCSYSISPISNPSVVAGGATGTVNVTAPTGCTWSSTSNAAWLTFSGATTGSGNGSVNYAVAANSATSSRTGTLTIAGQTFTVTQAGVACSYAISPTSNPSVVAGGATGIVNVTAQTGCAWSSTSNAAWITFSGATTGSGNGSVNYAVAANSSTSSRTGTLTIAGQTFSVTQAGVACSYAISPTSNPSVVAGGATGIVNVTAQTGCAWSSTSNAAWITFSGATSGSGNGSVNYAVAANSSTSSRTGTLTIAGQTFTVTQAGAPCSYSISPTSNPSVVAGGGTGSVNVTAQTGCTWSSTSNDAWITFSGATSGSGNGSVNYSVASNSSSLSRTGTLTIAGQTFTVTQAGVACSYAISPTSNPSVVAGGGTGSVTVTAPSGCTWSSTSNDAWITFSGATTGSGNGGVNYAVAANSATSSRTGTLTIAGQTFTVTQAGVACSYAISPTSNPSVVAGGGTGSVTVTAQTGCTWSSTSNAAWITFSGATTGSGNGSVNYSVASNTSTSSRTGTLTIAGQTFTVTQAGVACSYAISPTSNPSVVAGGGTGSVTVTAQTGCTWSSTSNAAWITFSGATTGSGNGSVNYSVAANTSSSSRTGTLTIAGQTFTVTQAGVACTYAISPTSNPSVVAGGATGSVSVTAPTGCTWSSTSNDAWITFSGATTGNGNGNVNYAVAANTSSSSRTGTLTIAGQTFTVTQAGVACTYAISPTSNPSVVAGGATGSVSVTAPTGCTWSSTSNAAWLTFSGTSTGSGNGTVGYAVAANASTSSRTGTLTIAGQTFTVTQAGVACSYAISPTNNAVGASAASGSVSVTAPTGCSWSSTSNAAWVTFPGTTSGSGNGTVGYSVSANTAPSSRSGTLTIAGQTFTVDQAGTSCTYSISPGGRTLLWGEAGSGSITVTAPAGCPWSSTSNAAWLTFSGTSSGTGNGTVGYSVAANDSTTGRTGTMTIAGQTFTVDQGGASCGTYSISPTSTSVSGSATTGSVAVTAPTGCVWSAISNVAWISFSGSQIGNGNGSVTYVVEANSSSPRSGTLTVAGQTFTVNQGGVGCSYSISPTSNPSVVAGGTTGSVNVTASTGCAWSSTSNAAWITFSGTTSGSGNGSVNYSVASNTSTSSRTGTLTIAGQTFTVTQAGVPSSCTSSISPTSRLLIWGDAASGSVSVTAAAGCSWSSTSNAAWLTFSGASSGTGNGTVGYSVAANDSTTARTGTMTIAGQTFTVDQGGATCGTYSISPTSASIAGSATTASVNVTAPTGCVWSAISNVAWISFSGSQIGNGNGSVTYVVEANTSASPRSGTLTVAGQTFTVNQGASTSLSQAGTCTYTLSPATQSIAYGGATGSATVTAAAGCTWTAVSNATSWITVTSGASGTGNGTVGYSVVANPDATSRSGSLTIAGKGLSVTQPANPCAITLTPNTRSLNGTAGSGTLTVAVAAGCAWTVRSNATWITATGSGNGPGSFNYSVTAHSGAAARTGTVTVGTAVFTITQNSPTGPQTPNGLRLRGQ